MVLRYSDNLRAIARFNDVVTVPRRLLLRASSALYSSKQWLNVLLSQIWHALFERVTVRFIQAMEIGRLILPFSLLVLYTVMVYTCLSLLGAGLWIPVQQVSSR